ncbi:MAG: hypothetical protein IKD46_03020 [Lentisphaeria bacterium]|nr:hypothetical protein [Lentisphaeria bacterium]
MRIQKVHTRERGAALVAALCLIVTAGVLVGSLVSFSRISAINTAGMTDWMRSSYVAEGAAARIRFLIEADRFQFAVRRPNAVDFEEFEHDRYLADGSEHVLDYYGHEIKFTISDGLSGLPFQSGRAVNTLSRNRADETLVTDAVELYGDRINDYIDSDDTAREDSFETEEYEAMGIKNMPRNAGLQYREELLWIPGISGIFPVDADGRFSLIRHFRLPTSGQWSIYTVPYSILRTQGGMTAEQAAKVLRAVREWQLNHSTPLEEALDETVLPLARRFSWQESGYYTVRISQTDADKSGARLLFTFQSDGVGGPRSKVATFIEFFRF